MDYKSTVREVNKVISGYSMDLTLRQIYYRLVAQVLIPNRRSAYNSLSAQLVKAREAREVDEGRIVDRSRTVNDNSFNTPEDFLRAVRYTIRSKYLRRFWASQPVYVEIWVEKDALSQVLAQAVEDFNTIVAPTRGYSSYSYLRDAAARFEQNGGERDVIILHFADHDPSGLDMSRDLERRLSKYYNGRLEVKRIALTFDQVNEYKLLPNPTKLADTRSTQYASLYGDKCWELDAIEPDELVRICQGVVEREITDWPAWESVVAKEKEETKQLLKRLKTV